MAVQVSPTSLDAFEECPRKYWFAHLSRPRPPKPPLDAYRYVGVAAHKVLGDWWDYIPDLRTSHTVATDLARMWSPGTFRDEAQSTRWLTIVTGWVRRYVASLDKHAVPVGIERTVSYADDGIRLSGRVDRVDERDGLLRIVDYKTGHNPLEPGDARTSRALALYAIAAARIFRKDCWRVELHHLPTGQHSTALHSPISLDRHLNRAKATAADITAATDSLADGATTDEVFPVRPGPLCGFCEFRTACPSGQAYPAADPHALLDRFEQEQKP
jgi:putative RecB family exonuclease